jgi:hypothetical protein
LQLFSTLHKTSLHPDKKFFLFPGEFLAIALMRKQKRMRRTLPKTPENGQKTLTELGWGMEKTSTLPQNQMTKASKSGGRENEHDEQQGEIEAVTNKVHESLNLTNRVSKIDQSKYENLLNILTELQNSRDKSRGRKEVSQPHENSSSTAETLDPTTPQDEITSSLGKKHRLDSVPDTSFSTKKKQKTMGKDTDIEMQESEE